MRKAALPCLAFTATSGTLAWNDAGAFESTPAVVADMAVHVAPREPRRFVPRWLPQGLIDGADEDAVDDLPRSLAPPTLTPMEEEAAALYLASAWHSVVKKPLNHETLAVLWGHWALETGRGQRMVRYNFAGLKGTSPSGGSVQLWTQEREDETAARVRRRFRAYSSPEEGARDYIQLLKARYPRALRAASRGSPVDFVHALDEGKYFTENRERYLRAIISLWREFLEGQVGDADVIDEAFSSEG